MTYNHDDDDTAQGIPGGVGLKIGMVGKFGSIKSLCFHTLVEAKVSDTDPEPSYEARDSCHGREIFENRVGTFLDTHVTKERKGRVEQNSDDGQSVRQSFKEYFWCIARCR